MNRRGFIWEAKVEHLGQQIFGRVTVAVSRVVFSLPDFVLVKITHLQERLSLTQAFMGLTLLSLAFLLPLGLN